MLIASTFLLWIVVAVLAIAVLALTRQIGVLRDRAATAVIPVVEAGPRPGDMAPYVRATMLDGRLLAIGAGDRGARAMLLMFVAPDCPVCRKIAPLAKSVAAAQSLDLVFVGDGEDGAIRAMVERCKLGGLGFASGTDLARAYHVGDMPYGVLIRADGVIAAKGPVCSRAQLEGLVVVPLPS